jgi:drug/metabolite transporter (DMT)-like permease
MYKEKFRGRDLITVVACLGGMALFFVGQLRPQDVTGNMLALASGLCFALYFLLLRHAKAREVNRASSVIYGSLLLVIFTAPAGLPAITTMEMRDLVIVLYLGTVQIGLSYLLFTTAMARGVRSLDAGIVGYIEPVLNPVWVFLVLGEQPSRWALLGGAIIIITVFCHMLVDAKQKRQARFEVVQH